MRANGARHHDYMMVAWVLRLHRKFPELARVLRRAAEGLYSQDNLDAHDLRRLFADADIGCLAVQGNSADIGWLAVAYAEKGCCALLQMHGVGGEDRTVWHLCLGQCDGYFKTIDYCVPPGAPRYAGGLEQYLTGEAVYMVHPVEQWCGNWDTMLELVDSL